MAIVDLGLLGTGSSKTAATTLAVTNTTGATIPAGTFIHIVGCWDNTATTTAPVITCSTVGGATATANHATAVGSGVTTTAGAGIWHQCFRVLTTASIASGATIATLTSDQSAVARAAHAEGWSGVTTTLRGTVTAAFSVVGTPSVATTGTALVTGDLVIGSVSYETSAQMTGDADTLNGTWDTIVGTFTTGSSAATNVGTGTQDKVVTASGAQTYNPTGPVVDTVACIYSLVPVPDPQVTQAAYSFYADGTETGAAALAAQSTAPTVDLSAGDVNLGLRVRLQETAGGNGPAATDDWQLQWKKGGDQYDFSNYDSGTELAGNQLEAAQSFTGVDGPLTAATFYLYKTNTPTGTVSAALWAHDGGTFGSTGKPTGTPLATSTTSITASTVVANTATPYTFTFDGTVTLTSGTKYFIGLVTTGASASPNALVCARDGSTPTHPGNPAVNVGGSWATFPADLIFEVGAWANVSTSVVAGFNSASLTEGAATTNRLGAGTGSFIAGKVSEDGLVDDLGWSASNYTELLYSLTLKATDLASGDTLRFRVVRNGATTGLTYTAVPTVNVTKGAAAAYLPPPNIHIYNPAAIRSSTW